MKVVLEMRRVQ